MHSSASSHGRSRSRRTSSRASPVSRSSVSPIVPVRRRSIASEAASCRPRWSGRSTAASRSTSPPRRFGRKAPASTCPSRSRCSARQGSFLLSGWPTTRQSESWRSTGRSVPSPERSPSQRERGERVYAISYALQSRHRRQRSPESSPSPFVISPRPSSTSAGTSTLPRIGRSTSARSRTAPFPTSPTSAARSARAVRSRSQRPARTTSC